MNDDYAPVWQLAKNLGIPNEQAAALLMSAGVATGVADGRITFRRADVVELLSRAGRDCGYCGKNKRRPSCGAPRHSEVSA
ncbi:hypothetical protein ACFWZ2_04415 [Streptomyces sp. NPDC059002]|uniref:hypothetical protein n=1 Tax=Streptomyces sp. NPDC059002 TaxID=3346690 RepID=UPI0036747867